MPSREECKLVYNVCLILCAIRSGKQSDPRLAFYCTVSTSSKTVYTGQSKTGVYGSHRRSHPTPRLRAGA